MEILAKGFEPSTQTWKQFTRLRSLLYYMLQKLRFGRFYDVGDTYIVGKKKG